MMHAIETRRPAFDTHAVFLDEWSKTVVVPPWLEQHDPEAARSARDAESAWTAYSSDEFAPGVQVAMLTEPEFRSLVQIRAMLTLSRLMTRSAQHAEAVAVAAVIHSRADLEALLHSDNHHITFAARTSTINAETCGCSECVARRGRRTHIN